MKKIAILFVCISVLASCSSNNRYAKNRNIEGVITDAYRDKNNNIVCVYRPTPKFAELGFLGNFSSVLPKDLSKCTDRAWINMDTNEITWMAKKGGNKIVYN